MSKIEWTNITWNPITGCNKKSEGCRNCYAETMHNRLRAMGQKKYRFPFENVIFNYDELGRFLGDKPKMIFVNSMSDTFNEKITDGQIDKILDVCRKYPQHIFQILTKRPERLMRFCYPPNVWLGVTVESAEHLDRIKWLKLADTATVKFLSCEPLLSDLGMLNLSGINWVICGGESGHNARPVNPQWVRNIKNQCKKQDVPFFFKQWGEYRPYTPEDIKNINKVVVFKDTNTGITFPGAPEMMIRVGKSLAGAKLDGKEYKEFPKCFKEGACLNI